VLRSLIHYRRVNLAVLAGAAVTCAVMTGALLTGDSVRGSLRELALGRLGRIDTAVTSELPISQSLVEALHADSAPVILMRGAVVDAATRRRAARVNVLGVEERFWALHGVSPPEQLRVQGAAMPAVAVNAALLRELGSQAGDTLVISLPRPHDAPVDSLLGRRELAATLASLRSTIAVVLLDAGPGSFTLDLQQALPLNVYVPLSELQRALKLEAKVNLLLAARGEAGLGDVARDVSQALELDDLGLLLSRGASHLTVESRRYVLSEDAAARVETAAGAVGGFSQRIATYLVNSIRSARGAIPYSTISALGPTPPALAALRLERGGPAIVGDDEILISSWAQQDLQVARGDRVDVTYYVVGDHDQLTERTMPLRVAGVVAMEGPAADPALTPDYPGIADARDIASWDPPFPVELSRIRQRDEDYWDQHRATPKAFVTYDTGKRLWGNRHGVVTSIRIVPRTRLDPGAFAEQLRESLRVEFPLESAGLRLRDLRQDALAASEGATDFGALFFGFSMFLIVSSAILAGLLFRLGVEQRAAEAGLLLAIGYSERGVRRRFLMEGLSLAAAGSAAGLAAGVGYAWLLMLGLRTIWLPAVGTSHLYLHVTARAILAGAAASMLAVSLAILWSVRRIARVPSARLLAGSLAADGGRRGGAAGILVGSAGLLIGAGLVAAAAGSGTAQAGLAFGAGACALIGALGFFGWWCSAGRHRSLKPGAGAWMAMAARNCGHRPARSVLSATLIASASFVIVTVAASRHAAPLSKEAEGGDSAGYTLLAESDIPLHHDPGTSSGRFELGMQPAAEPLFEGVEIASLRLVPGEDVSCLNLYAPTRPRLLGVAAGSLRPEAFGFADLEHPSGNPWDALEADLGPGVIPAIGDLNSVLWILHLGLGRELLLTDELGAPMRLRFVGLLADSPFQGEILIAEKHLMARFPSRSGKSFFLIAAPAGRSADLTQTLESALAPQGFDVVSIAERIASYHAVENTYLSTFQVLGGLGLLLGTVGLAVVMVRNVMERRAELATMAAVGFTRARLARLILAENGFLLGVGLLAGSGAALAAVAPRLLEVGGGAPWLSLVATLAVVLATGMIAGLVAVRGALSGQLLPLLKSER